MLIVRWKLPKESTKEQKHFNLWFCLGITRNPTERVTSNRNFYDRRISFWAPNKQTIWTTFFFVCVKAVINPYKLQKKSFGMRVTEYNPTFVSTAAEPDFLKLKMLSLTRGQKNNTHKKILKSQERNLYIKPGLVLIPKLFSREPRLRIIVILCVFFLYSVSLVVIFFVHNNSGSYILFRSRILYTLCAHIITHSQARARD